MVLAVFNLLPAFPMDGGRVLRALLSFRFDRGKATRIAAGIGQVLAMLFVFFGFFANIWLVFIGVFIYLGAGAEANFETTKTSLHGHTVRAVLMKKYSCISPDEPLANAINLLLDGQDTEFIITQHEVVVGILTRIEIIKGLSEMGKSSSIFNVMRKDYLTLSPDMSLSDVYPKLMSSGSSVAPVIENEKLIGIVDKDNINEFIMVNEAILHADRRSR